MGTFSDTVPKGVFPNPPEGKCVNCNAWDATEWFDNSGILGHGFQKAYCRPCVLDEQIAHARACAERLPDLEAERAQYTWPGGPGPEDP